MSKLVKIKAEALKWANNRIKVIFMDSEVFHKTISDNGSIYGSMYGGGAVCVSPQNTVEVNPKEYEQAVIDRIKEMIPTAEEISKDDDLFEGVNEVWVMFEGLHKISRHVKVSADPRPWESEYTINLQEEDNE